MRIYRSVEMDRSFVIHDVGTYSTNIVNHGMLSAI